MPRLSDFAQMLAAWRRRRAGPRKGYIGWAGRGNLGDDAMFEAAQKLLGGDIELLQSRPREQLLDWTGAGGLKTFQTVVLGGGTLINAARIPVIERLIEQKIPLYAMGTGVGSAGFSMADEASDPRLARALSQFRKVGVRGPLSLKKLQDAGATNVQIIGDLALALTPTHPLADYDSKTLLVNLAPGRNEQDIAAIARLHRALASMLRDKLTQGWSIIPVAFEFEDIAPLEHLMRDIGLDVAVEQPASFDQYCMLAKSASLSIGLRLHSSVFASACGLPNALIAYRDKCRDFAETVGMEDALVSMHEGLPGNLADIVEQEIRGGRQRGEALHAQCLKASAVIREFASEIS